MSPDVKVPVEVDGRTLTLTNLGKVLYPDSGFTKAEVLDTTSGWRRPCCRTSRACR